MTIIEVGLGLLLLVPMLALFLAVGTIVNGYTLHLLWLWFMTPILGLPALTIGQAIAVSMVVSFITYQYIPSPKETKDDEWLSCVGLIFVKPLIVLGFAQVMRHFI